MKQQQNKPHLCLTVTFCTFFLEYFLQLYPLLICRHCSAQVTQVEEFMEENFLNRLLSDCLPCAAN